MPIDPDSLPLDRGDEIGRLMRRYLPVVLRQAWSDADALVPIGAVFDLDNPFVQDVLDTLARRVTRVAETTREEIRALVGKQADEGWSVEELARHIRDTGATNSVSRSKAIAATETADAYSRGAMLAFDAAGIEEVEWLAEGDACEICAPLHGKRVKIGDEFADGIASPAAHVNCRCALLPVVRE